MAEPSTEQQKAMPVVLTGIEERPTTLHASGREIDMGDN
jgi:hypothetical protein